MSSVALTKPAAPPRELVQRFIETVTAGRFVEALQGFYGEEASMQENNAQPRRGLTTLIAHEQKVIAAHTSVRVRPTDLCLIDGDNVVIRWIFEFTRRDGHMAKLDELTWQRWRDGKIVQERFYYDPGQLSPA